VPGTARSRQALFVTLAQHAADRAPCLALAAARTVTMGSDVNI